MRSRNLYAVKIYGDGVLLGSIFAAAFDVDQAKAIGSQWALDRGNGRRVSSVKVQRHYDPRPVYVAE